MSIFWTRPNTAERRFERALEARYEIEDPWGDGWRWKVTAFTPGWVEVEPVFSRVRDLYRRVRGWGRNCYLGGYIFVRRRDGLVVQLGSNPLDFDYEVFKGVFNDIGDNSGAAEIEFEIVARSRALWGDDSYETDLRLEF